MHDDALTHTEVRVVGGPECTLCPVICAMSSSPAQPSLGKATQRETPRWVRALSIRAAFQARPYVCSIHWPFVLFLFSPNQKRKGEM